MHLQSTLLLTSLPFILTAPISPRQTPQIDGGAAIDSAVNDALINNAAQNGAPSSPIAGALLGGLGGGLPIVGGLLSGGGGGGGAGGLPLVGGLLGGLKKVKRAFGTRGEAITNPLGMLSGVSVSGGGPVGSLLEPLTEVVGDVLGGGGLPIKRDGPLDGVTGVLGGVTGGSGGGPLGGVTGALGGLGGVTSTVGGLVGTLGSLTGGGGLGGLTGGLPIKRDTTSGPLDGTITSILSGLAPLTNALPPQVAGATAPIANSIPSPDNLPVVGSVLNGLPLLPALGLNKDTPGSPPV
ncbi:hypothetical protein BGZ60DRAFT_537655 [Tricladium varicosporioides]|nr:hypothetical protein BGZ60DRAFT_537655 [Hymenoscyphus varicosporioides]